MADPKPRDLLAEPSAPKTATPPEGVRDLLSDKPAVFYPSFEKEKRKLEAGPPEPLTIEPKKFSPTEAIEAGGTGAAISAAAPKVLRTVGGALEKAPGPVGRAGKAIEQTGRVLENVPLASRTLTGATLGTASDIAGQGAEVYLGMPPSGRFLVELGVGTVPGLNKFIDKYVISRFARSIGGYDARNFALDVSKAVTELGDQEKKTLDRMAKALGGEKYEQGTMEKVYALIGKEALQDMTAANNQASKIIADAKTQADALRATDIAKAQSIQADANRKAAQIMQNADDRMKAAVSRRVSVLQAGEKQVENARAKLQEVGYPGEVSEIGQDLRNTILGKQQALTDARTAQKQTDIALRNQEIADKVAKNQLISDSKGYRSMIADIKDKLLMTFTRLPKEAPVTDVGVVKNLQEILKGLEGRTVIVGGRQQIIPPSFEAIDQVRRNFGEVFKGKPPVGYEAIDANTARDLYFKLSKTMGDYSPAHKTFIQNYETLSRDLDVFGTKAGKKATALDDWIEGRFGTDTAAIPGYYFKTADKVKDLIELTGDKNYVQRMAGDYVARTLRDMNGTQMRTWYNNKANSDWLSELPALKNKINSYISGVEEAERYSKKAIGVAARIEGAPIEKTAERRAKGVEKEAATQIKALPGERAAATVESEAAKSAKPFEEEAARLQKIVNQKKSPVDEFANYVIAENAPANIKKAAEFVARTTDGPQAFRDATISMMARVPKTALKDLYYTRIKYALEGSGLYSPQQINELSRRVDAARDPTIVEKVLQGWFTAVAAGEVPSRVNSGINSIIQLAPF